ncbi:hypothetical protein L915_10320 [Phytophthora nicotianae]|uniref:CDC45-like protein n=1 Tax=Phytophthora nicotianae TaxID=4792 RepID=W2GP26_PHYNI|nr:hypothetical protein L915_10320 [Phytophthora nicotianae]
MLWPREEFHAAYGQIKHDALQSGSSCSVLILVALDVDALCAAEILTRLLRADMLSYSLLAVRGYEDVLQARETRIRGADGTLRGGGELRSVIMLNCGAIVDVAKLLALPTHVKCYVLDSHRPIHLANIYDEHQQIVVFDDGALALDEYPAFGPDLEVEDFEEEEEESEGEEQEDDNDDESEGEAEVEFGTEDTTQDTEKEENDSDKRKRDEQDDDEDMEQSNKRRKEDDEEKDQVDAITLDEPVEESAVMAKRRRREEILRYYRGSFHGAPAASVAFELAQQVNSSQRDLLWFAIIGLTKQFVLEEIDTDNYNLMVTRFQDEVLAIDAPTPSSGPGANGDEDRHPGYDDGKISFEEEYRFMCYRHWSLYEAMYYSDYVASKLGLYHDQARRVGARNASGNSGNGAGDTALHVFLARMGFSLRQSQQKFSYMPLEMKQMLREKTQEMAPEFGLDDLFYGSFKRTFAFQYQLCAADAVYGLQALLEAPENYVAAVFEAETQHQNNTLTSLFSLDSILSSSTNSNENDKDGDDKDAEAGEDSQDDFRQQNFMLAHTALACQSVTSSKLMESGIKVAMSLKQAIVRVGLSIMERKLLVRVKHFRYVCLNVPEREQELFANANVLTQLALFLLNVHRASGKWGGPNAPTRKKPQEDGENEDGDAEEETVTNKSIVPLMLITRNPAQNCFLVVGLTCPSTPGEIHRNTLGTAFKLAAGETGANFRQDGFTSAVMEIQIDEIQYFVEQLHNVLDA